MRLSKLAASLPGARVVAVPEVDIQRVIYDSRKAQPGDLFVAIPGAQHDGAGFAADAIQRGASAVAAERSLSLPDGIGFITVPAARPALADLANALYGYPSERLRVIGVTGTDGKTTTCQLIAHLLATSGRRVGWITTVDVRLGDEVIRNPYGHTTPEASEIHELLARLVEAGVEDAVVEVISHALALDRVRGVSFDAAVFTNLAPEHLDFHHTMEEYAAAKAHLFELLDRPTAKEWLRMGVVNADDPASLTMVGASSVGIVSYAIDAYADLRARDIETGLGGSRFLLETPIGEQYVWTHLVGRHNIANALAAAAVGLGWGLDVDTIVEGIASAKLPAGRMQQIDRGQPFRVVVDFAHTPQALATTIASLRAATEGSVFLVFGLAGGRDAANRPVMGELAARETDYFVISTDDPLHEDPATIAAAVAAGAAATGAVNGRDFTVELDRRAAIEHVLRRAGPGDVVLLAGKGHEQRMLVADRVEPWNDAEVASGILATLGYR